MTEVGNPATLVMFEDTTPTSNLHATSGSTKLHDDATNARHPTEKYRQKGEGGWPKAIQSHHNQGPWEKAPTKTKKNPNQTVNIPVAKISLTRGPGAIKNIRNLVKVKVETTKQEPRLYGPTVTPGQRVDKVRSVPVGHHPRPGPTPAT